MQSNCPHEEELRAFAIGAISTQTSDDVRKHLNGCLTCHEILGRYDNYADEFVTALRKLVHPASHGYSRQMSTSKVTLTYELP
jgi:hypothetical protein